ncbi:MAG: sugar phosphate isomerase/epimerase [Clostridiales bacterium]|nr:sugar phosphate isomerase/epimerase [Clostridiales bacterium]
MKQIKVGTCIPGTKAMDWIPHMLDIGCETVGINFHMSLGGVDLKELAPKVVGLVDGRAEVGNLGFYCNAIENEDHLKTLHEVIDMASAFKTGVVSTFAGGYSGKSVEDAMPKFKEVFSELAKHAEDRGVKLAIENCPMGGTWNNITCNIGFNPAAWEMMFNEVNSPALGLEWEPAHQMAQLIDPIANLRQWADKIVHIHGKDATVDWDAVKRYGVIGQKPFAYMRMPGFGDVNWRDVFFILHQHGYEGDVCIEGYHDPIYSGDWEMTAQKHAVNYLKWARGGDFTPNPWDK